MTQLAELPDVLILSEVAEVLHVDINTVRRYIHADTTNRLPAVFINRNTVRVLKSQLMEWIESQVEENK